MRKTKGFTLIELLVVISIIGLLTTLAVVALNSARQKARDAKRVADIKQIQTALELFYNDQSGYPAETGAGRVLGSATYRCLDENGFAGGPCSGDTMYMGLIPANPTPNGADYTYNCLQDDGTTECTSAANASKYSLTFTIESATGSLTSPNCTANQEGITCAGTF